MLKAVAFDLFGTILEIGSLRSVAAAEVGEAVADALVARWRERQVFYSFHCTLMGRYENFDTITGYALDYALAQLGLSPTADARARMRESWSRVTPFADVAPAAAALRGAGIRTAVLTNGTPSTAASVLANAGVAELFEHVWSVDAVRAFKPTPKAYALAEQGFGLPAAEIGFVTSNGWDAIGAQAFGFRVFWCNRANTPRETLGAPPAAIIATLADLLAAIESATPAT